MKTKNWSELEEKMDPERRAAVAKKVEAVIAEMDPVTEALRPGRRTPEKSPILGLTDAMPSHVIRGRFQVFQDQERDGTRKVLEAIEKDLGSKVRIADKARREAFDVIKEDDNRAKQGAQKDYQAALRAAKSVLDATNAKIAQISEELHASARKVFNDTVDPINADLAASKKKITEDYSAKMTAAVVEVQPIMKAAQAREEKARAEAKAKKEAEEAAAKEAASVPAGPVGMGAPLAGVALPDGTVVVGSDAKAETVAAIVRSVRASRAGAAA